MWRRIVEECGRIRGFLADNNDSISRNAHDSRLNETISRILFRIHKNVSAIEILASESCCREESLFLKLPVGLLMRCCLNDGIMGLSIAKGDEEYCIRLMDLCNRDYVDALHHKYALYVYKDKLLDSGVEMDEEEIRICYALGLEDAFLSELDLKGPYNPEGYGWGVRPRSDVYEGCKRSDALTKTFADAATGPGAENGCIRNLAAYFKYFSQYEHYSERGNGDASAPFGLDNVNFLKAFEHLMECVRILVARIT